MDLREIDEVISSTFPFLVKRELKHGFSWWHGEPQKGIKSNRVMRARQTSDDGHAELKLAVSARMNKPGHTFRFTGARGELIEKVDNEINLFKSNFMDEQD